MAKIGRSFQGVIKQFKQCDVVRLFTTDLQKFGVILSYQLICRYFRGFDLELDPKIVAVAKGKAMKHGGAGTLLFVGVSTGTAELTLPEVNDNLYGPPEAI